MVCRGSPFGNAACPCCWVTAVGCVSITAPTAPYCLVVFHKIGLLASWRCLTTPRWAYRLSPSIPSPRTAVFTFLTTAPRVLPCPTNRSCSWSNWSALSSPRRSQAMFYGKRCPSRTRPHCLVEFLPQPDMLLIKGHLVASGWQVLSSV